MRCLEKQPQDRYQTALALREALLACTLERPWTQSDAAIWWREVEASDSGNESADAVPATLSKHDSL